MYIPVFGLFLFVAFAFATPMQFCKVDEEQGVDFCASFTSYANPSSGGNDVYIRTSTRFRNKLGWSAVGTGETMTGSLMFVFYPASATSDNVTVSVRTTRGHYPPRVAPNAPHYDVLATEVRDEYYDVTVVCYSCDKWDGNSFDITSTEQSMIYSTQVHQKMQSASREEAIQLHTDYEQFEINMASIHSTEQLIMPEFTPVRQTTGKQQQPSHTFHWHRIHGITMLMAFTIIVPSAVVCLRSGMPHAFTVHWVLQLTAVLLAFMSASLAIAKSWDSFEASPRSTLTQHIGIGTVVTICMMIQPVLGYYHHILYMKTRGRTLASYVHIWMGRLLLALAWINTALGFKMWQVRSTHVAVWFVYLGAMIAAMIWTPQLAEKARALKRGELVVEYKPLSEED